LEGSHVDKIAANVEVKVCLGLVEAFLPEIVQKLSKRDVNLSFTCQTKGKKG